MDKRQINRSHADTYKSLEANSQLHASRSRNTLVRIGSNAYRVSHHKLTQRPLSTTVRLPPVDDSRVSEYVYGSAVNKAALTKLSRGLPSVAMTVDFSDQLPPSRIRNIAKRGKTNHVLFRWDLANKGPKPTWHYLTRNAVVCSSNKPLPSINESITQVSFHDKQDRIGRTLAAFSGTLTAENLIEYKRWHEKVTKLRETKTPPNTLRSSKSEGEKLSDASDNDVPLAWQRGRVVSAASGTSVYPDENPDDLISDCKANEVYSLFSLEEVNDTQILRPKQTVKLIDIHVPEKVPPDHDELLSNKMTMVETWLRDNAKHFAQSPSPPRETSEEEFRSISRH